MDQVSHDDLVTIGTFGMLTGLSINALRHYDDVGLLIPAFVDPATGYRRYRPAQAGRARQICLLRGIELPVEQIRECLDDPRPATLRKVLARHRAELADRAIALARLAETVDRYIAEGVAMPELKSPRITQVTITVTDLAASIAFYRSAFDATWNEDISSFQFGTWPADDFFLLTVAHPPNSHGEHCGPTGTSRFGLVVSDLDGAHRRAIDAGATEVQAPYKVAWKPRASCVADLSGNYIDLYQA